MVENMIKDLNTLVKVANSPILNDWDGTRKTHHIVEISTGKRVVRIDDGLSELAKGDNKLSITAIKLLKRYDLKAWHKVMKKGVQVEYKHFTVVWKSLKTTTRATVTNNKTGDSLTITPATFNPFKVMSQLTDKAIFNLVHDIWTYGNLNQVSPSDKQYVAHDTNWKYMKIESIK